MPYVQYAGESDTNGISGELWNPAQSALEDIFEGNYSRGFFFRDNFIGTALDAWYTNTVANTGSPSPAGDFFLRDEAGGVLEITTGQETAVNNGCNVQLNTTAGEIFNAEADYDLFFEARCKQVGVTAGNPNRTFIGLGEIDTTLYPGTSLTAPAFGFQADNDDETVKGVTRDTSSATTDSAVHTFVAGEYVKLGFRVKGTSRIEFYVNGSKHSQVLTSNIGGTLVVPSAVSHCGTTDSSAGTSLYIDWWKAAKLLL